jgi:RimJ/RimL family protein N-acetyltransferase
MSASQALSPAARSVRYAFYRRQIGEGLGTDFRLPAGYAAHWGETGSLPRNLTGAALALRVGLWTAIFRLTQRDEQYRVFLVMAPDGSIAHHSMVLPKYNRFPFMGAEDLQIGDVWTEPRHRCRGLATFAVQEILRAAPKPDQAYWYVAAEDNFASIRTAEKDGFLRVCWGRRTRPFGISLLGAYEMEG